MKDPDQNLILTCLAVVAHEWSVVLLQPRSKRPKGATWEITKLPSVITRHWKVNRGNIGLVCGPDSEVMVLDFDNILVATDMFRELGPLDAPWVKTGSGKPHFYCRWEDGLPAKMDWQGQRVGEIQRGPALQHVVMPPSVHPDTGEHYSWLVDPQGVLPVLPDTWRDYLKSEAVPDHIPLGNREGHPEEDWTGPPPNELLRRALAQPGGRTRRNGIKFQCPGCRKEGHDRSLDNALVGLDGRWGCAVDPRHKKDIGEVLGVLSVTKEVLGELEDELREPTIDDLE